MSPGHRQVIPKIKFKILELDLLKDLQMQVRRCVQAKISSACISMYHVSVNGVTIIVCKSFSVFYIRFDIAESPSPVDNDEQNLHCETQKPSHVNLARRGAGFTVRDRPIITTGRNYYLTLAIILQLSLGENNNLLKYFHVFRDST